MREYKIEDLIDIVFKKLSLRYGRDFTGKWEGIDLADVKSDWAIEMSGFERAPHSVLYALSNLPESKAPNVAEFRAIARRAPAVQVAQLEAPRANPAVVSKALAEARALLQRARG